MTAQDLLEQYCAAFGHADVGALMNCFTFPLHVAGVADGEAMTSVAHAEEWPGVLERLLEAYGRMGVTVAVPLSVEITEPMNAVAVVGVHWELQRRDREPVYDFTAVYTLARTDGQLRIVTIAHDELPKIQAAMQRP